MAWIWLFALNIFPLVPISHGRLCAPSWGFNRWGQPGANSSMLMKSSVNVTLPILPDSANNGTFDLTMINGVYEGALQVNWKRPAAVGEMITCMNSTSEQDWCMAVSPKFVHCDDGPTSDEPGMGFGDSSGNSVHLYSYFKDKSFFALVQGTEAQNWAVRDWRDSMLYVPAYHLIMRWSGDPNVTLPAVTWTNLSLTFSHPIPNLDEEIQAPHTVITGWNTTDGGLTWTAEKIEFNSMQCDGESISQMFPANGSWTGQGTWIDSCTT